MLQIRTCRRRLSPPSLLCPGGHVRTFIKSGHERPFTNKHDLPNVKSPVRRAAGVSILLITVWSTFVLFATNEERLSSAVIRRITAAVVSDSKIYEALGHNITMEPSWYLFGSPRIAGQINQLQGHVDVKFRIRGEKGGGTVYFSSIRRGKGRNFEILRFRVITDSGDIVDLSSECGVF